MGMTPDEFFWAFVLGNYKDYRDYPGSVRRAFNVAVSASHLADHYFTYSKKHNPSVVSDYEKIGDFIEHLINETDGLFRDIRSVSNVYKHLYTDSSSRSSIHSSISSTGAIEEMNISGEDVEIKMLEEHWYPETEDDRFKSKVVYTRKDGQTIEFLSVIERVIDYWNKLIR